MRAAEQGRLAILSLITELTLPTTNNQRLSQGSQRPLRVLISAGEASGDLYGAQLIEALRRLRPEVEVFGLGGVPMAEFSQALGERVRQPLDEIIARGMDTGVLRRDGVATCATAVTGILNMFILAHVFGGASIDKEAPMRQVRYYLNGLCAT